MTPKERKVMELALEELAVRFSEGWHEGIKIDASDIMLLNKAAQALAQPSGSVEQELTNLERHERNVQKFLGTQQPKEPEQEPVAWGNLANWCLDSDRVLITDKDEAAKYHRDVYDLTPLYTTPPQRTWVGLDWNEMPEIYMNDKAFEHGAQWAEAKLKEKNT